MSGPAGAVTEARRGRFRFSLRGLLTLLILVALVAANGINLQRRRTAERELAVLRQQVGYLGDYPDDRLVATRLPSDRPLVWRLRVRVPEAARYRIAFSAIWPAESAGPLWFAAVGVPPGESNVIVRIAPDPRDDRWKLSTLVQNDDRTRRAAATLKPELAEVFRGSHEILRAGVGITPAVAKPQESIRLIEDRWLVGAGSHQLYGSAAPDEDQPGLYVELQPDTTPL